MPPTAVATTGVSQASASSGDSGDSLTSLGVALGTPAYMSPEQAAADPHVDHRADIYAVGALGYEMLCGQPPFTGPTPHAILGAHITRTPEPLERLRPSIPASLAALLMRCLEKRPADRWQTAEEFHRATFFAGKVLFEHEGWIHRLLHNETAVAVQSRLHWKGHTMVILPVRVDGRPPAAA